MAQIPLHSLTEHEDDLGLIVIAIKTVLHWKEIIDHYLYLLKTNINKIIIIILPLFLLVSL